VVTRVFRLVASVSVKPSPIDAKANSIDVVIKNAGRTLIQVIDNGFGMSEIDARMAFERHATSKVQSADDLFALKTKGFRGEALASIAAIILSAIIVLNVFSKSIGFC
jgi:DNA mismatch repair ATPase MutL